MSCELKFDYLQDLRLHVHTTMIMDITLFLV